MNIDYSRDSLMTEQGRTLVEQYYMREGDVSPQDVFARAASFFASDEAHAQRMYDAISKQHLMLSSPILSNAGHDRGMPISCFLSYVPDTVEGLIQHEAETKWLSILGGGVGGHWADVRAVSKKSPGPIPFIHSVDAAMTAYKQGQTRKGAYAAYLDVSHPDIVEFLQIRVPTGGDVNRKCLNIHNAVNLTDDFMMAVMEDKPWDLKCPATGKVRETVSARELWTRILEVRHRTGEPYLNFIDTANKALHPVQKTLGLRIHGSNLCNEIHLVTSPQRTAICCLLSMNLETYDEWKDSNLIADVVEFLDNVLEHFIKSAPAEVRKAVNSAKASRDIGIGAMGWHGYLMKNGIPFESERAMALTNQIFCKMKNQAVDASVELALKRGSCEDAEMQGKVIRNLHLLAIAPNANSSIICNATASIEPIASNGYAHRTRIGTHLVKNKHLEPVLRSHVPHATLEFMGMSEDEWIDKQWQSIVQNDGSVQHLTYLTDHEKEVFKTFKEIDMMAVINQAGIRQRHLCQGQSINLHFPALCDRKHLNDVHLAAWAHGLKGLYYLRTSSIQKADKVSVQVDRAKIEQHNEDDECTACQA